MHALTVSFIKKFHFWLSCMSDTLRLMALCQSIQRSRKYRKLTKFKWNDPLPPMDPQSVTLTGHNHTHKNKTLGQTKQCIYHVQECSNHRPWRPRHRHRICGLQNFNSFATEIRRSSIVLPEVFAYLECWTRFRTLIKQRKISEKSKWCKVQKIRLRT